MALITTTDTLHDGTVNVVVQLNGFTDEMGDPEPIAAVDVSELSPPCRAVKVTNVEWSVGTGSLRLAWATATGSEPFLFLTGSGCMDYSKTGGAVYRGDDGTGDVLLSTDDFVDGSNFSVKLRMRKR